MGPRAILAALTGVTAILQASAAAAQPDPANLWDADLEFGYVSTAGNTETTTINARADAKRETDTWRYQAHLDSLNSSEDDERSAERYYLTNKLDRKFAERSYIFGFASYEDDRFSGYDWQAVVAVGYGYRLLENDTMTWDVEAGPGYRIAELDEGSEEEDEREIIARGHTRFTWQLSPQAVFEQEFSVESGSDNTVSRSVTSLKSTIVDRLALKLSYTVKYTNEVPENTERSDRETAVTIVYSFF